MAIDAAFGPDDLAWRAALASELEQPYCHELAHFVAHERAAGKHIYPPAPLVFRAMNATSFDDVAVVILGQDPYHGPGQAHGLAFSVAEGVRLPPSLRNIFKEYASDLRLPPPASGDLTAWSERGVLLLNTVLTVEEGRPASHAGKGWERLTGRAIELLARHRQHVAFLLWGDKAQAHARHIDPDKHLVVRSAHPSPLSAHRGFFGSRPFSRVNQYRAAHGLAPIDWQLPTAQPLPATASTPKMGARPRR